MAFYTADMSYRAEAGRFKVHLGGSSVDVKETEFDMTLAAVAAYAPKILTEEKL